MHGLTDLTLFQAECGDLVRGSSAVECGDLVRGSSAVECGNLVRGS